MVMILSEKIDQRMVVEFVFCLRSPINYKIRDDLVPSELEAVCVEIIKPHSKPFVVTTVYRPPSALSEFFDHFEKLIKAMDNENKEIYILGDFNCDLLRPDKDCNIPTKKIKSFMNYISYHN
jgi:exonuclease III